MIGVSKLAVFIDSPPVSNTRTKTVTSLTLLSAAAQRSMFETQAAKQASAKRCISNLLAVCDKQVRLSLLEQSDICEDTPPLRIQTQ
jgi:hypothetical protein